MSGDLTGQELTEAAAIIDELGRTQRLLARLLRHAGVTDLGEQTAVRITCYLDADSELLEDLLRYRRLADRDDP